MLMHHDDNSHPHHLECPRCGGRHTIVTKAESHYVCLRCGWERDLSGESFHGGAGVLSLIGAIFLLFLLL